MNLLKKLIPVFIALSLATSACNPCKDNVCQNGAVCEKGDCLCASGYEGENCETAMRDKMLGVYAGTMKCSDEDDLDYDIIVTAFSANAAKVTLSEDGRAEFQCDVTGTNTFSMEFRDFIFSDEIIYYNGTVDGDMLTIKMKATDYDNNILRECSYTGKRR